MCCPSLWRVSSDFTCPCATHSTRSQLRRPSRIALTASQQTDEFSLTSAALKTRRLQPKREKRRVQSGRGVWALWGGPAARGMRTRPASLLLVGPQTG